jgi:Outer membrane protein beta-barrel domain
MTRGLALVTVSLIGTLGSVPSAFAQRVAAPDWTHGTLVDLSGGAVAAPSADTRPALGAGFGWEINHWIAVEGTGTWIAATQGDSAFAAEMKAVVNVTRPNTVVPFLAAGVGLYRAMFDTTAGPIPDFYQRREVTGPPTTLQTFTDPSFVFAAGVNVFTGRHISIRPDITVRLVYSDSQIYPVTAAVVHLTYHFEVHDVSGSHRTGGRHVAARE